MNYSVHGPYTLPRYRNLVTRDFREKRAFWSNVEDDEQGLASACGCYVFTIRGIVRYVGLAAKQTFKGECFKPHKLNQYDLGLQETQGEPRLILIAKRTPEGRFAKPTQNDNGHGDIVFLEQMLIGMGIQREPDLLNIRGTKLLKSMHVPGVLNTTQGEARANSVQALRFALGL